MVSLTSIQIHTVSNRVFLTIDMGKVFVGIQVPPEENQSLDESLNRLGYTFIEETDNVVYKTFLRGD